MNVRLVIGSMALAIFGVALGCSEVQGELGNTESSVTEADGGACGVEAMGFDEYCEVAYGSARCGVNVACGVYSSKERCEALNAGAAECGGYRKLLSVGAIRFD